VGTVSINVLTDRGIDQFSCGKMQGAKSHFDILNGHLIPSKFAT